MIANHPISRHNYSYHIRGDRPPKQNKRDDQHSFSTVFVEDLGDFRINKQVISDRKNIRLDANSTHDSCLNTLCAPKAFT